jgi:PEP-CTERM motif
MHRFSLSQMCTPPAARVLVGTAVLLGYIISARPAQADTFKFVIPTTTVQNALTAGILAANPSLDPNLYAFYDIYIRPSLPDDPVVPGGNNLPSYTAVSDVPPITSGADQWVASLDTFLFDAPNVSFRFTFSPLDSVLALVTPNPNVNGKIIDGRTAEQMPGSKTFQMWVASTSPLLAGSVNFQVFGYAYQFTTTAANSYASKSTIWSGNFNATGEEIPEPGSLLMLAGGSILFAILLRRRKATLGSHAA